MCLTKTMSGVTEAETEGAAEGLVVRKSYSCASLCANGQEPGVGVPLED